MTDQLSMFSDHWQNQRNKGISFYATIKNKDGENLFLWKPHMDYDEWVKLSEKGRKKPFRWKTSRGAVQYMTRRYYHSQWKVLSFDERKWKENEQ